MIDLDGLEEPAGLVSLLAARYGEPHRVYHTLAHVAHGLAELNALFADPEAARALTHPAELLAAWLFHDAVYDPARQDNEERSADLARQHVLRHFGPSCDIGFVTLLITLTARHGNLDGIPLTEEERLFLDVDTSILGAVPELYDAYADGIRAEFEPIAGAIAFAAGRKAFLAKLLDQPSLFLSERYRFRLESIARGNVKRELARL